MYKHKAKSTWLVDASRCSKEAQRKGNGRRLFGSEIVDSLARNLPSALNVMFFLPLFLFYFIFFARFPVGEKTSLLPCGSNTSSAQGARASGKRGLDLLALYERRNVYPHQTMRQLRKVCRAEGVLCLSSWQQTQQLQMKLSLQHVRLVVFLNLASNNSLKKDFSGLRPAFAFLRLFLFHSLLFSDLRLTSFFSQYKKKLPVGHRLIASSISILGEPEWVNLVELALKPDYLLLDIFLHRGSETWTQWTIEAARVKVHHRPYSFEDGSVVYPANVFDSCLRGD